MTVQEQTAVMAWQPGSLAAEGVRSLEVRWIFPGQLPDAVARWFGRFPAALESRQDAYLLDPPLRGLSVKVRGGGSFEVKVYRGSPGILDVAGCARGRMESWQKWSFPCDPPGRGRGEPTGWRLVRKTRRVSQFSLTSGSCRAGLPGRGEEPGCAVEVTEVGVRGQAWWTLGFEAAGPAGTLRGELEAAAALVFADTPHAGVEFGTDDSKSYAEWLCPRPDAGRSRLFRLLLDQTCHPRHREQLSVTDGRHLGDDRPIARLAHSGRRALFLCPPKMTSGGFAMRIGWITMKVIARPGRSRGRHGGSWLRIVLAGAIAIGIVALASCSSSKPAYCTDRSNLQSAVNGLTSLTASSGASAWKSQVQMVQSAATTLVNSAKSDFPSQTSAITSSVNALKSSVATLSSSPSAAAIATVTKDASNVKSSVNSFTNATSSQCS
jgi:hypothetical protein